MSYRRLQSKEVDDRLPRSGSADHAAGSQSSSHSTRCTSCLRANGHRLAAHYAEQVSAHGDDLLDGGNHCATTFAALARGIALLAHEPGGVGFADLHWCVGSGHHGTREPTPCTAETTRTTTKYDTTEPAAPE